jgi:broad specificity phosphatase PhoE
MTKYLYLATQKGVSVARREKGAWRTIAQVLSGHGGSLAAAHGGTIRTGGWRVDGATLQRATVVDGPGPRPLASSSAGL